jgi:hypothetical protein
MRKLRIHLNIEGISLLETVPKRSIAFLYPAVLIIAY